MYSIIAQAASGSPGMVPGIVALAFAVSVAAGLATVLVFSVFGWVGRSRKAGR